MPEDLWTEVHNSVQESVDKVIPNKKKCKMVPHSGFDLHFSDNE